MSNSLAVSKYFLHLAYIENAGETFSAHRMQELLFMTQGFSFVINDKPLFEENFIFLSNKKIAILSNFCHYFEKYGANGINFKELSNFNIDEVNIKSVDVIQKTYVFYNLLDNYNQIRSIIYNKFFQFNNSKIDVPINNHDIKIFFTEILPNIIKKENKEYQKSLLRKYLKNPNKCYHIFYKDI
ncbi:hypothetical protein [Campylobacter sp. RM12651]|uniref:hypothetical protein n=1 Tax=Campylobacter sp. RM12651 TaxID=1660079 RepID=UPI001EFB1D1D|nr:hypothetical protein [Campylobacter sp. RM12651]ULO03782.1 hypothetical protein AVBRAN_1328 [Campylobacter sp. RM12651]